MRVAAPKQIDKSYKKKGSALADDQAPASLTTWLRPYEEIENHKIDRDTILKYRKSVITLRTESDKVRGTGTQRPQRRLRARATTRQRSNERARSQCAQNKTQKAKQNIHIRTYNNHISRYNSWLTNKGWWGTTADNRVPPRGTVGEARQILSTNAHMVSNRARDRLAASKPFERPRDPVVAVEYDISREKRSKRGITSNEARLIIIENITYTITNNRRIYRTTREMIPKEEWKLARPTPQDVGL